MKYTRMIGRLPLLLLPLAATYCLASLLHFAHNAEYLSEYPNLPAWLSRSQVYVTWFAITLVGVIGLWLARGKYPLWGLILVAAYALLGFDGLGHYAVAPMSAHTVAMNLTIWVEVAAAALLLVYALRYILLHFQSNSRPRTDA